MPSVVDALLLTLGLDPSGFTKGRKQAESELGKVRDESVKTGKQIEAQGKKSGEFLGGLRRELISLFAVFTAGSGIKEFMRNVTSGDARLGRMSTTLKTSTEELSRWSGIMKSVGGNADSAMNSYANIVSDMEKFALTGNSQVIPYFRALGVNLVDAQGKMKSMTTLFRDLARATEGLDPAKALELLRGAGIDDDTARVIIRGTKAIDDLIEAQKRLGAVSKADADAAAKREASFANLATIATTLGRTLLTELSPAIVYVTEKLTDLAEWFKNHPREMKAAFVALTIATAALSAVFLGPLFAGIAALASPIGLLLAALTGLAAVGGYFFEDVKEWGKSTLPEFERAWSSIAKTVSDVGAALRPTFTAIRGFFGTVGDLARSTGDLIKAAFVGSNADIGRAWKRLAGDFSVSMAEVKKIGAAAWPVVQNAAAAAMNGVQRALSATSSWLVERFGETGAQIANALQSSFDVALAAFAVVKNGFVLLFDLLTGSPEEIKASWTTLKVSLAKMGADVLIAWRDIGPLIVKGLSAAFDLVGVAWDGLMSLLPESWSRALNSIVNVVGSLVQAVRRTVQLIVDIFVGSNEDIARSWSGLVDDLGAVFARIGDAAAAIWPLILAAAELAADGLKAAWNAIGNWLEERFGATGTAIRRTFEGIASSIGVGLAVIRDTAIEVWSALTGAPEQIRAAWEALVKGLSGLAQSVAAAWSGLGGIVSDGIQAALKGIEGAVDRMIDYLKGRLKALWDSITDIKMPSWMRTAGETVRKYNPVAVAKDAGLGLYDYLTGGGKKEEKPPGRALGGPVHAGTEYEVGEFGKERFVPDRDGTIVPHSAVPKDDGAATARAMISAALVKTFDTVAEVGTKTNTLLVRLRDSIDDLETTIKRVLVPILLDVATPLDELSIALGGKRTLQKDGEGAGGGDTGGGEEAYKGGGKAENITDKERLARTHEDVEKFMKMGWTKEQAQGIVANILAESQGNPHIVGDGGRAYGLAQWHPDRQANFKKQFGKDIRQSTRDEQLAFIDWELRNTEKAAGDRLKRAKTSSESAAIVSKYYERPAAREEAAANRGALAKVIERSMQKRDQARDTMPEFAPLPKAAPIPKIPTGAPGSAISDSTSNDNRRTMTQTNSQEINIGSIVTQATDANGVAKEIGPALQRFSTAGDFNYGIA